jgi:hypothetical protein
MFKDYSFLNILNEYKKNHYIIEAYLNNKTVEMKDDNDKLIMDMPIPIFLTVLVFSFGVWIFALYVLIKYWKKLPQWAQVFGILGLITGFGPVLTILVVFIGKEK